MRERVSASSRQPQLSVAISEVHQKDEPAPCRDPNDVICHFLWLPTDHRDGKRLRWPFEFEPPPRYRAPQVSMMIERKDKSMS